MSQRGDIPPMERLGVLLAGDLYAIPQLNKRGGLGDVDAVWASFEQRFRWVIGVGGNHDQFSGRCDFEDFPATSHRHPLDGSAVELDGLRVAGLSGVIGRSGKPWRRAEREWSALTARLLKLGPDVLLLHHGPSHTPRGLIGHELVERTLQGCERPPLTICGHCHWPHPFAQLPNGAQVINADYRCVVVVGER